MELCDLVYLVLRKKLRDTNIDGKDVEVALIYDKKVIDVADYHYVLVYQVSETSKWYSVGATDWYKEERVSVDVRTDSKTAYHRLKEQIFDAFDGRNYVFARADNYDTIEFGVNASSIERSSVYVRRAIVLDPTIFSEGECIKLIYDNGEEEFAWVFDIYGNEVWLYAKEATIFLVRPNTVAELSDRMKGLFRFVVDVEGKIICERE